jgi:hypothetical protein
MHEWYWIVQSGISKRMVGEGRGNVLEAERGGTTASSRLTGKSFLGVELAARLKGFLFVYDDPTTWKPKSAFLPFLFPTSPPRNETTGLV